MNMDMAHMDMEMDMVDMDMAHGAWRMAHGRGLHTCRPSRAPPCPASFTPRLCARVSRRWQAGFQFAIVFGGIGLGRLVDETKQFKAIVLACLASAVATLAFLGVSEGYIASFAPAIVVGLLLSLGASAGPVQPIAAELAVEVAYPCDENAVEATQQLSGNLFSALLVPLCASAARFDLQLGTLQADVRGDTLLLLALLLATGAYFTTFDAPLLRTMLDEEQAEQEAA
jgi:FLVCR family feline leukemia virus subgroup C receptor-related protein